MSVVTSTPIQQAFFLADIATPLVTYNRLRWYRSRTGASGSFEAATAAAVAAAVLGGAALTPHAVDTKQLKLKINGLTEVIVTFSDPDPVTTAQAVVEINNATGLLLASDDAGYLKLTTVATGTGASIEILESDAAPYLGFVVGAAAVGLGADNALSGGVHEYFFTDQNSDSSWWYKTELRNSATAAVSPLSVALPGARALAIPKSETVPCYVRLASLDGSSLPGRTLVVYNIALPNEVTASNKHWGIFRNYVEKITDADGYAELRLLRGATVDVNIAGTGFTRRLSIPLTGDSVDLLDPALVAEDEFGIASFDVPFAIRTS